MKTGVEEVFMRYKNSHKDFLNTSWDSKYWAGTSKIHLTLYYTGGTQCARTRRWSCATPLRTLQISSYFMTLFLFTFSRTPWGIFQKKVENFEKIEKKKNFFLTVLTSEKNRKKNFFWLFWHQKKFKKIFFFLFFE